jgi:hypothetical protein
MPTAINSIVFKNKKREQNFYSFQDYWFFGLYLSSAIPNNTTFGNRICFRPQAKEWEARALLHPLAPASIIGHEVSAFWQTQQSRCLVFFPFRTETAPVSETLCSVDTPASVIHYHQNPLYSTSPLVVLGSSQDYGVCKEDRCTSTLQ